MLVSIVGKPESIFLIDLISTPNRLAIESAFTYPCASAPVFPL
jgi:hypothetical protein